MPPIPCQILILEPEPLQRDLIRLAINRLGYPLVVHGDTRSAEDALHKELPLVAIVDLFLPQESGVDWLNRMKKIPGFSSVPVLVLSSLGYPDMVQKAAQAGARAFLTKPVDTDLLVERVIRLIARGDDLPQ